MQYQAEESSETQAPAGAARVRWWQQSETTIRQVTSPTASQTSATSPVAVAQSVSPVATAPATIDIGEELEAEALRRTQAEARGERVVIFANNRQNVARFQKRMLYFGVPFVALYTLLAILQPATFFAIWAFIVLEYALLYLWARRAYAKQTLPAVTLSDAGIEVHTLGHDIGLIHWSEIEDIRAYNLIYRYVGITPRDPKALCARLSRPQATLIRANDICSRYFYKPFRRFVAPINLAQQNLPISADVLVAKIEDFRARRRV